MAKEKSLDIQVDVNIINEKNKKGTKKKSCDEGVQKNLEKLHSRKNYHDSGKGSSQPATLRYFCSGKEVAREAVVNYRERATMQSMQ